jgi:predicted secreted protein
MNSLRIALAASIIAVLCIAGCAAPQPAAPAQPVQPAPSTPSAPSGPVEYTSTGQKIEVPVGVTFVISVNANPTTGYTWEVGFDQSLLKLVKRYTPSKTSLVGAGGVESFEFEGIKKGDTEVYLNYKRPFEQNDPNMITKKFHVVIK